MPDVSTATGIVTLLIALGGLATGVWRAFTALRRTLDRIEKPVVRELTTNGGGSIKDHVDQLVEWKNDTATVLGEYDAQLSSHDRKLEEVKALLLDEIVHAEKEHTAVWMTLAEHGIERRRRRGLSEWGFERRGQDEG